MAFDFIIYSVGATYAGAFSAFYAYLLSRMRREGQANEEFATTIMTGLRTGILDTSDDVLNVYQGIYSRTMREDAHPESITRQLRKLIAALAARDASDSDRQEQRAQKNKLTQWIQELETKAPYEDLPEFERNLLADLRSHIAADDSQNTDRKIHELASAIRVRAEDIDKARRLNRWTVPLSITGLILTVVFGIISLVALR